jgi:outer membrane protein assembly factor BamB
MKRVLKLAGIAFVVAAVVVAALWQFFGLRVQLDGGGSPHLVFVESADARAEAVRRHRAAQAAASGATEPRDLAVAGAPASPAADRPLGDTPHDTASTPTDPPVAGAHGADAGASASSTSSPGVAPTSPDASSTTNAAAGITESAPVAPAAPAASGAAWAEFRGPARDGRYRGAPLRTAWPDEGLAPAWKQPVGGGYASFAVARGRAFTIEQRGRQEVVAAYDVASGRELWQHGWDAEFREFMGGDGPRATPTWAGGFVYALGATGELRCLEDATGRLVWRKDILADNGAVNLPWGMAASPLVVGETLVVLPGGPGGRSVVAYDRRTGARVWSALDDKQAYVSPMLVTLAGVPQLLVVSARRLVGLSPDGGALLWEHPWVTDNDINASQPLLLGDDRVFVSASYGHGAAVVQVTRDGDRFAVREIWQNTRMKNRFGSSVLHEGHIYGLDESILACVDAATGELRWKGGRYGYGQVLLADGHLIVLAEDGDLALVRATPAGHQELARFSAIEGKTWNSPAMAGGRLLVRNLAEMAAFDVQR